MTKPIHKEVKVILNILDSFENTIPNDLIPKIFENLKLVYETPKHTCPHPCPDLQITHCWKVYEIDNQFYEFGFRYSALQFKTRNVKFNKIIERKKVIENIYMLLDYYGDKSIFIDKIKHLKQVINQLLTGE